MTARLGSALVLWGLFLTALTLAGVIGFGFGDWETPSLLGGAALIALVVGLALALLGADGTGDLERRPGLSPPTAWTGIAIAMLCVSAVLGFWLTLIGAGMLGLGIGGMVREGRAQRAAVRAIAEGSTTPGPGVRR